MGLNIKMLIRVHISNCVHAFLLKDRDIFSVLRQDCNEVPYKLRHYR